LLNAEAEIAAIEGCYRSPATLTGAEATVAAVSESLSGASVAHVAAHGRFRADNPLFSSLELVDGPLTVHDLEQLSRAPELLVLSACDAGMVAAAGWELMGALAALFRLRTRTVIAAVVPVLDHETADLMVPLHHRLAAGASASAALAAVVSDAKDRGTAFWTAASFVCFGAA
jgi:CHAT domain-containing protein